MVVEIPMLGRMTNVCRVKEKAEYFSLVKAERRI